MAGVLGLWRAQAPPGRWPRWLLVLLPCYAALQLVPLPPAALRILSPARAELHEAVGAVTEAGGFAPLSVAPAATFDHLLRIAAYLVVFLLVREAASQAGARVWRAALPVVVVAALEAALGVWQWRAGVQVHGTYVNRNHFAGLLEMALPLAVMYAAASVPKVRLTCAALAVAGLLMVAIINSLSRMGFIAALFGLLVAGVMALEPGRRRWVNRVALGALAALVVAGFVFLPPDALIGRFAELAATEEIPADTRAQIWRQTLDLIREYPVFGCGLGGYEAAFLKHKRVAPLNAVDYAHNDYLQGLAEMGVAGFAIVAALVGTLMVRAARRAAHPRPEQRRLAAACAGALAAMLLHSLVDFNLYIPANAMALAWICGLAATRTQRGRPQVIEVEAAVSIRENTAKGGLR